MYGELDRAVTHLYIKVTQVCNCQVHIYIYNLRARISFLQVLKVFSSILRFSV